MTNTSSLSESAGHTPGPWHVEDGALTKGNEHPTGFFVCHPKTVCDATALVWVEHEANAHLIAAAPDLLTTGAALLEAAEKHIFGDECKAEREALRAALSKALGQGGE